MYINGVDHHEGPPSVQSNQEVITLTHSQCWAKSLAHTGNFPIVHKPNWNFKISAVHVPTSDNVNQNMLIKNI